MQLKTKERLEEFLSSVSLGEIPVNANAYPPVLEPYVQQAVSAKRNGLYEEAVNIYLDILESMNCANSSIMSYLFKVILCAEEFALAYGLLAVMEEEITRKIGPQCPIMAFPGGPVVGYIPWWFTEYKREMLNSSLQTIRSKNIQYLLEYVKNKSGNPNYRFTKSDSQILAEITPR